MYCLNVLVLLITLSVALQNELVEREIDPSQCRNDLTHICSNCQMSVLCVLVGGVYVAKGEPCTGEQVCDDGIGCVDSPTTANGESCLCPSSSSGTESYPDPYSKSHYLLCVDKKPYYINCGNISYVEAAGECADIPDPEPCTDTGVFPNMYDCTYYLLCASAGAQPIVKRCQFGYYFNPDSKQCEEYPQEFVCPDSGAYRDPIYCNQFYVCNGTSILAHQTCPDGEIFAGERVCIVDDGSCTDLDYCSF